LIVGMARDGSKSFLEKWSARACMYRALSGCFESESENEIYLVEVWSMTQEYKERSTILYVRRQVSLRDQRAFGL